MFIMLALATEFFGVIVSLVRKDMVMLSAMEAFEIYLGAADVTKYMAELEEAITYQARDRKRCYIWDYDFAGVEPEEKVEIIKQLRAALYDVKDEFLNRRLIIRW